MLEQRQDGVIKFLGSGAGIESKATVIETHISYVFLLQDRVFKLKRAIKLPYADFSTLSLRLAACNKEITLNRRTAPLLYRGVRCITREEDGRLALDGKGEAVDAVVEMAKFEQDGLFDRIAGQGNLDEAVMTKLARSIARFHGDAEVIRTIGGVSAMRSAITANEAGFATSTLFPSAALETLGKSFRDSLDMYSEALDRRAQRGKIRRCHGDLHLRNICLFEGEPTLFDCIEFNDALANIDVLYDLAFLLMDLWRRNECRMANLVLNRYLDATGDEEGFVLLPFFMAVRAAVRAHVLATQAEHAGDGKEEIAEEAQGYFSLARHLLLERVPQLVALSGFSGSGKTTVTEALAPHIGAPPGARVIESDRIRKGLFGVVAEMRLPEEAYKPEVSQRVYAEMMKRAGVILRAHGAVVANAVFDRQQDREMIEDVARDAGIDFMGFQLVASPDMLKQRVSGREQGVSDATVAVLERQLEHAATHDWWRPVDAGRPVGEIVAEILRFL